MTSSTSVKLLGLRACVSTTVHDGKMSYVQGQGLVTNGADYLLSELNELKDVAWERYSEASLTEFAANNNFSKQFGAKIDTWKARKMHIARKGNANGALQKPLKWDRSFAGNITSSPLKFRKSRIEQIKKMGMAVVSHQKYAETIIAKAKEIESKYFSAKKGKTGNDESKDDEKEKENGIVDQVVSKYGQISDAAKQREYSGEGDAEIVVRIDEDLVNQLPSKIRNDCFITTDHTIKGSDKTPDTLIVGPKDVSVDEVDFKDVFYFDEFEKRFETQDTINDFYKQIPASEDEFKERVAKSANKTFSKDDKIAKEGLGEIFSHRALLAMARGVVYAYEFPDTHVVFHDYNRFVIFKKSGDFADFAFISQVYNCQKENISFVSLLLALMHCREAKPNMKTVVPRQVPSNEAPSKATDWTSPATLQINVEMKGGALPKLFAIEARNKKHQAPQNKGFALSMMGQGLRDLANGASWRENNLFYFDCGLFGRYGDEDDRGENNVPIRGVYNINAQLVAIIHYVDINSLRMFENLNNNQDKVNTKVLRIALASGCPNVIITTGDRSVIAQCYPFHGKQAKNENEACDGLVRLCRTQKDIWLFIEQLCVLTRNISYTIGEIAENDGKDDEEKQGGSQTITGNKGSNSESNISKSKSNEEAKIDNTSVNTSMSSEATSEATNEASKNSTQGEGNGEKEKGENDGECAFSGEYWLIWEMESSSGGYIVRGKRKTDGKCVFIKRGPSVGEEYKKYRDLNEAGFGKYLPNEFDCRLVELKEETYYISLVIADCGLPITQSPKLNQEKVYEIRDLVINKLKQYGLTHNDFAGRNVLFDDKTEKITLIDWDIKKRRQRENEFIYNPMTEEQKKWYYFDENKKYRSFRIL